MATTKNRYKIVCMRDYAAPYTECECMTLKEAREYIRTRCYTTPSRTYAIFPNN